MREIEILAMVGEHDPDEVYKRLSCFEDYQKHSSAVLSVRVQPLDGDGNSIVDWEVKFRDGILRWTEHDHFDQAARTITFEQVEGDIDVFQGAWRVNGHSPGSMIAFSATFDLGLPSLADLLEPIAEAALVENIRSILLGMFGEEVVFLEAQEEDRV